MMKSTSVSNLFASLCCAAAALLFAEPPARAGDPPGRITYQGFLTGADGTPLGNSAPVNKKVIFRIWDHATKSSAGNLKWSEEQAVAIDKGHFSVLLGEGSKVDGEGGSFSADLRPKFAGGGDRYLELHVDGKTLAPRLRFLPAPYSVLAYRARGLTDNGGTQKVFVDADGMGIDVDNPAYPLHVNGAVVATSFSGSGSGLTNINADNITSGTITGARIATDAVSKSKIPTDAVGEDEIAADAVGQSEIRNSAVGTGEIINGTVATVDLADGAVTGDKLDLTGYSKRLDIGTGNASMRIMSSSYVNGTDVVSGALVIQNDIFSTIQIDSTVIQSTFYGSPSTLKLNAYGGRVEIGGISKEEDTLLRLNAGGSYWEFGVRDNSKGGFNFDDLMVHKDGVLKTSLSALTGVWVQVSDRNLKGDIVRLNEGFLEKLKAFGPVRFRWKSQEGAGPTQIGFIAQEVQQAYPELVSDSGGQLGLSYATMSAVAIGAVKELDARTTNEVSALKQENAALKQQLADLLARVQALESKAR